MADPFTIAAIGLTVGSTIYGATEEAKGLRAGARADEANARTSLIEGVAEADAIRRAERATSGEALAALGMNGLRVDVGSPVDLLAQNAVEREYDLLNTRYRAESEARAYRDSAKAKRGAARGAIVGGVLRAGAQALTGASSMSDSQRLQGAYRSSSMPVMPGMRMPVPSRTFGQGAPMVFGPSVTDWSLS